MSTTIHKKKKEEEEEAEKETETEKEREGKEQEVGGSYGDVEEEGRTTRRGRRIIYKIRRRRKRNVHDPGKYRGITLLSQVLKLLERVLDARIRIRVEVDFGEAVGPMIWGSST